MECAGRVQRRRRFGFRRSQFTVSGPVLNGSLCTEHAQRSSVPSQSGVAARRLALPPQSTGAPSVGLAHRFIRVTTSEHGNDSTERTVNAWFASPPTAVERDDQEGAEVGYNPHKPERAAHTHPSFFTARLPLAVDVVAAPAKQSHSQAVRKGLWSWWEKLEEGELMRFEGGLGKEDFLSDCEQRNQKYLGGLLLTKAVK
jgi:hypothetical protein